MSEITCPVWRASPLLWNPACTRYLLKINFFTFCLPLIIPFSVRSQVRVGLLSLFSCRTIKVTIQSWVIIYMRMRNTKVVCHSECGFTVKHLSHPVSHQAPVRSLCSVIIITGLVILSLP